MEDVFEVGNLKSDVRFRKLLKGESLNSKEKVFQWNNQFEFYANSHSEK